MPSRLAAEGLHTLEGLHISRACTLWRARTLHDSVAHNFHIAAPILQYWPLPCTGCMPAAGGHSLTAFRRGILPLGSQSFGDVLRQPMPAASHAVCCR